MNDMQFNVGDRVKITINKRLKTNTNPMKWLQERSEIGEIIKVYGKSCDVFFSSLPREFQTRKYRFDQMEKV